MFNDRYGSRAATGDRSRKTSFSSGFGGLSGLVANDFFVLGNVPEHYGERGHIVLVTRPSVYPAGGNSSKFI
jgi:hypothetical protein